MSAVVRQPDNSQIVRFWPLTHPTCLPVQLLAHEDRPTFMQEIEEDGAAGHYLIQRPTLPASRGSQQIDQAVVQGLRNHLSAVVPPQQGAKQVRIALNLRRVQPEHVAQKKIPGGVL